MLKKILQKIKQVTQLDSVNTVLSFLFFFLVGLLIGFIVADHATKEIFCDCQDYYMADD